MKSLIVIVALLAAINTATSFDSDTKYMQYLRERSQIERFRTQFESVCPGHDDELDEAIQKLKECSDRIDENSETACSAIKNHFLTCSKPLVQLLGKCFPEESKDVPQLIFEAVNSGISYLCKTNGEHIFELANNCILKSDYRSMRCERRLRTKLQQYKSKPPTKTDVCELVQSMKPCLHSHLQQSCGNAITRESFMGMFDALTIPCQIAVSRNQLDFNHINEVEILE